MLLIKILFHPFETEKSTCEKEQLRKGIHIGVISAESSHSASFPGNQRIYRCKEDPTPLYKAAVLRSNLSHSASLQTLGRHFKMFRQQQQHCTQTFQGHLCSVVHLKLEFFPANPLACVDLQCGSVCARGSPNTSCNSH